MCPDGEFIRAHMLRLIDQVQDRIEGCIRIYMNKSECKNALQLHQGIRPDLTEIIWNRIEKENGEFFRAYYVRLVCVQQISKFNILLEEQVRRMRVMALISEVPAPIYTHVTSPYLNRQLASESAPAQQNLPSKLAEDMQKIHNFGSTIQPSLPGSIIDEQFCDKQNTEMYSSLADAPRNTRHSRTTVHMPVMHEVGSSSNSPMDYVPYLAPIPYVAGPSNPTYFQEKVCMSDYDANFGSCQYSVRSRNPDATMIQTDKLLITREAGYGDSLTFNPGPYRSFVSAD